MSIKSKKHAPDTPHLFDRIRDILESARSNIARTVNTTQVMANWLIGREIVEEEQRGNRRADYGLQLVAQLSERLSANYGKGWSPQNLFYMKQFYQCYPRLLPEGNILHAARGESPEPLIVHALRGESDWQPGVLHSHLSWTHYRTLLRVSRSEARDFYEIEAIKNAWSARELERQINSLLFDRLAKSRDKKGLMRLAVHGQEVAQPIDVLKDPVVLEFLDLPESPRLVESKLEQALIGNKLIRDFTPNTPKYVFKGIAEFATAVPEVITGDNYEQRGSLSLLDGIEVNIFNISKINSKVRGGKSPRIKRLSEYLGQSYFEYLAGLPDLVLIMDKSHRYRASAGIRALNELKPLLGLELTATPFVEAKPKPVLFKNVIRDYPLGRAIEDGFVKEPAVVTQQNFDPAAHSPEALERIKLMDGVRVHEETKVHLLTYAQQTGEQLVKPFILNSSAEGFVGANSFAHSTSYVRMNSHPQNRHKHLNCQNVFGQRRNIGSCW